MTGPEYIVLVVLVRNYNIINYFMLQYGLCENLIKQGGAQRGGWNTLNITVELNCPKNLLSQDSKTLQFTGPHLN